MKNRRKDSHSGDVETKGRQPISGESDCSPRCQRRRFRLSPIAALVIASMAVAIGFGLENNWFDSGRREQQTRSIAEAVDISLQRLMRTRVAQRLEREHRLIASSFDKRPTVDDELGRLRANRLYLRIREMMTQHLRHEGYDRVSLKRTLDPKVFMLSDDVEFSLNKFLHSVRTAFPAPNEKVATYLEIQEHIFGSAIVTQCNDERYDAAFYFLINLLCEFPDDLETVTGAVSFDCEHREEIENRLSRVLADPKD
jgi:ATP-dependent Clp protease adapter protein ClpS